MDLLEMLKTLLGMELWDDERDDILNYYLSNSKLKIAQYKRLTIDFSDTTANLEFEQKYFNAICTQAKFEYNNQKTVGIKSYTEGKRSVSYRDNNSTDLILEVKSMIGHPSIVMF